MAGAPGSGRVCDLWDDGDRAAGKKGQLWGFLELELRGIHFWELVKGSWQATAMLPIRLRNSWESAAGLSWCSMSSSCGQGRRGPSGSQKRQPDLCSRRSRARSGRECACYRQRHQRLAAGSPQAGQVARGAQRGRGPSSLTRPWLSSRASLAFFLFCIWTVLVGFSKLINIYKDYPWLVFFLFSVLWF